MPSLFLGTGGKARGLGNPDKTPSLHRTYILIGRGTLHTGTELMAVTFCG